MEIQIFDEPESAPFPGFRYCLIISPKLSCISNYVFNSWTDALVEGIRDYEEDWLPFP